jgi:predicted RNA-binding protein (virulence factor B family)
MAIIGRRNWLPIARSASPGFYLDGGTLGEILLPGRYLTPQMVPGTKVEVFLYLDSEDRLVATTETPLAMVGEFAGLKVVSLNPRIGAFLDWGLPKDLLLPFREQDLPVRVGQAVVVAVYLDQKSRRIVASSRLRRHLKHSPDSYQPGQAVQLLIVGPTPLGYQALVGQDRLGLLYHDRRSAPLAAGQKLQGFIQALRPDGKLDLSLDRSGYQRVAPLKDQIVRQLESNGGQLPVDDGASPQVIRDRFGCSKKAFKQALGALYKSRRIAFKHPGIALLDNTHFSPGR